MEILSIIPARGGSKGISLKNIVKLNGKPLISYTIKSSLKSKMVTRTVVSTDNMDIAKISESFGAEVIMRPKELANDSTPLEPVIDYVIEYLEKQKYYPDIIIILQPTSPLRNEKHIDDTLNKLITKQYDSILSGYSVHTFLWKYNDDDTVSSIDYDPNKRPNRQELQTQLFENGAIFAAFCNAYLKNKSRISGKIGFYLMPIHLSYNIDSLEDLKHAEMIIQGSSHEY